MLSIQLHQLQFFCYHGLYPEEQLNGNNFEVNVDIATSIDEIIETIHQTVDYVTVYQIIQRRMQEATPLLETLAQQLITLIHQADNRITHISINIKKIQPPIPDFKGTVGITVTKDF